jgi:hypothetical protein
VKTCSGIYLYRNHRVMEDTPSDYGKVTYRVENEEKNEDSIKEEGRFNETVTVEVYADLYDDQE